MILLYILSASVILHIGCAEEDMYNDGHSVRTYPNPRTQYDRCRRKKASYICDPDGIISEAEADQLQQYLEDVVKHVGCPCSHYSCSQNPGGYKIGIALAGKIQPVEPIDDAVQELSDSEWEDKKREQTLHQAQLFAKGLKDQWRLGPCDEDVIILYSLQDGVLYTAVGDVAKMKLNSTVIRDVSLHARHQFGPGGSIFKGLMKMVADYRSVFQDSYEMGRPQSRPVRNHAVSTPTYSTSFTILAVLLMFLISVAPDHSTGEVME